jgi:F-type H+-transporting ATPase subunit delta
VQIKQIAREYAKAILLFSMDEFESVHLYFSAIETAISSSHTFVNFLLHPGISTKEKMVVLEKFSNKPLSDIIKKITSDLLSKRAVLLLPLIDIFLVILFKQSQSIQDAELISAKAISDEEKKQITSAIEHYSKKSASIIFKVDPTLIGGFKLKIEDDLFDNSIRYQLERINDELLNSIKL